jgi:enamine deaminase RidA (YjgF/YER057c/UK114 family)
MPKRISIEIDGFKHQNPIPGASRVGNIMMSSVISGRGPGGMPETLEGQIANIFQHVRDMLEAAGGGPGNVVKMEFHTADQAAGRAALNVEWEKMFPDPASRPARHTAYTPGGGPALISCTFVAVLD